MRKFAITLMMAAALAAKAQIEDFFTFNTSNQQIVQTAVEKGFIRVTSSYRLQDLKTKKLYGRNGTEAFGTISSWGIKVNGGFILSEQAIHPWKYDDNFNKYRGKYNTIHYQTIFTEDDKKYVKDSINVKACDEQNLLFSLVDSVVAKSEGFTIDVSNGKKDGWIVWLTEEKDSIMSFLVLKKKIEYKSSVSVYEVEQPNTSKEIVAGVFVVPVSESVGNVRFDLCGVLVRQNEKWIIVMPAISSTKEEHPVDGKVENNTDNNDIDSDLTPIKQDKKKKYNKKDKK